MNYRQIARTEDRALLGSNPSAGRLTNRMRRASTRGPSISSGCPQAENPGGLGAGPQDYAAGRLTRGFWRRRYDLPSITRS
jgi:hypothetical protein